MEQYKVLLPRRGSEKPVQIFCNNRQIALNEARELSCRNQGYPIGIYLIHETLIEQVSCTLLESKAQNEVVQTQKEKDK
jgi:hypothetical protein